MDKILLIIGVVVILLAVGFFLLTKFNKKRMDALFMQISMTVHQVPKQKKKSFILLMLMETLSASKNKSKTMPSKLNNQKYINMQMLQMSKLLKEGPNPKDKMARNALKLLNDYYKWEDNKRNSQSA